LVLLGVHNWNFIPDWVFQAGKAIAHKLATNKRPSFLMASGGFRDQTGASEDFI
jgi:hypothetical protein